MKHSRLPTKVSFVSFYDKRKLITRPKTPVVLKSVSKVVVKLCNMLFIPVLILAVLSLIYLLFIKTNRFAITDISIQGAQTYVNSHDLEALVQNKAYGTNILLLDTSKLSKNLAQTFLGAKKIQIKRALPNKLAVVVTERAPMAVIYNDNDYYIIDDEGYVLGVSDKNALALPKIRFEGDVKVGYFINSNLVPVYLELMSALSDQNVKASSVSFYPNYVQLYLDTSTQVLLSGTKNVEESVGTFADLYKQLGLEGKTVKKIDLRYDKVIVSYE